MVRLLQVSHFEAWLLLGQLCSVIFENISMQNDLLFSLTGSFIVNTLNFCKIYLYFAPLVMIQYVIFHKNIKRICPFHPRELIAVVCTFPRIFRFCYTMFVILYNVCYIIQTDYFTLW